MGSWHQVVRAGVAACACAAVMSVALGAAQPSALINAARRGDIAAVRALAAQGIDVNVSQGDGVTPLHLAAERGDAAMVSVLLAAGASVDPHTRVGDYTPLHLAARSGAADVVAALVAAKAGVQQATSTSGVQPLHLAAGAGSAEAIKTLLDAGADVNAREREWGQTALMFAASANRLEAVRVLLARGADVRLTTTAIDLGRFNTETSRADALQRQVLAAVVPPGQDPTPQQMQAAIETARRFFETGKAPEPPGGTAAGRGGRGGGAAQAPGAGDGAAQAAPREQGNNEEGPPPNISAKGGLSALHHAARQGHVDVVRTLLEAGAPVDGKTGDGHAPLLVALINGQFDVAMALIERGADVNLPSDSHGITPLWATVNARWQPRTRFPQPQEMDQQQADYMDVMKALMDRGADPNARIRVHPWYMVYTDCGNANCGLANSAGSTAFWRAAYSLDVPAMKFLVARGADPNVPTMAPRRAAPGGRGGGAAAPAAMDPSGLPIVPFGGPGVFPLHAAAGAEYGEGFAGNAHRHAPDGWLTAVKYLVEELGADVNMRDNDGYTPVHHAAARGDNAMIQYFVSKGADVKAVSRRGQTTVDMANGPVSRISPFPETIALLEKLGAKNNHKCQSC